MLILFNFLYIGFIPMIYINSNILFWRIDSILILYLKEITHVCHLPFLWQT